MRAGTAAHDLKEVASLELKEPSGWARAELWHLGPGGRVVPLRAFCVQVAVLANHQNGRDTHVRGVRLLAPRPHPLAGQGLPLSLMEREEAAPYAVVR